MIFLFILVYFIVCALLFDVRMNRGVKYSIYFSQFLILVLVFGLRYRVGGDSLYYENAFTYLPDFDGLEKLDLFDQLYQPLWYIMNAFSKSISDDFMVFQFIHALIINSAVFYFISKYCSRIFLGSLFYYVFYSLLFNTEVLRESLAVVLFVFAYPYIFKKKFIHYYVLCFLAYMFHAFAMFTFIVPFLVYFLRKPFEIWQMLLIAASLFFAPGLIISLLLKFADFNIFIMTQMEYYSKIEVNVNGIIKVLFDAIPIFLVIVLMKKFPPKNRILIPAVNLYFVFIVMSVSIAGGARIGNYFIIMFYIAAANLFHDFAASARSARYAFLTGSLALMMLLGVSYYYLRDNSTYNYGRPANFYHRYAPYHSVFDPQKDVRRENIFKNTMRDALDAAP